MEAFLEAISLNASAALRQQYYDGWVLRFTGGQTRRSNCVNILRPSTIDLGEKIAFCEAAYERRGMRTIFKLADIPAAAGMDEYLSAASYELEARTAVMTLDLQSLGTPAKANFHVWSALNPDWLKMACRIKGLEESRQSWLAQLLNSIPSQMLFASVQCSDEPAAIGLGILERGWVGLFDIITAPDMRGRGYGTLLLTNLLNEARARSANHAYLQVTRGNEPAERLYAKLGFAHCYDYWYRVKPVPVLETA